MSDVEVKQDPNDPRRIYYVRTYSAIPFYLGLLPNKRDRYTTLIIADPNNAVMKNFLQFIRNCHSGFKLYNSPNVYENSKLFTNFDKSIEELNNTCSIYDLSPNKDFSKYLTDIEKVEDTDITDYDKCDWLKNFYIQKAIMPNNIVQDFKSDIWQKHYTHTIWLASDLAQVPRVLINNAHVTYITEKNITSKYLELKIGMGMDFEDDVIFCLAVTLRTDIQLMTLSKKRFLEE